MKKMFLLPFISMFLLFPLAKAFPLDISLGSWTKGTLPASHYVNIAQILTPYGDGISVNTIGYPGAFELYYDFFAYYNEIFVVPPSGSISVKGYFYYNDTTPHLERKYIALYLLYPDLSGYIANETRILDYAVGDRPGNWYYRSKLISGLKPGTEYRIAFGRSDLCDMERRLEACWAAVEVISCRVLNVPSHYTTIQQAIKEASNGDVIQVASGTYYEHLLIDKNNLKIMGENSSITVIDAKMEEESTSTVVNITGRNIYISGFTIRNCPDGDGITVYGEDATITENNIMNNTVGIRLLANNTKMARNNIYRNAQGIWMQNNVKNCTFYFNSFFNNTQHLYHEPPSQGINKWDNGYAGNFWSNHTCIDTNKDGIGETPYEINANNIDHYPLMSPYMLGDVNYDGKINIRDVSFVSSRFGCKPPDPLWNPNADVNEDKQINIRDVSTVARKFGKTWEPP
jgi:parallel beta-helix repeat protein